MGSKKNYLNPPPLSVQTHYDTNFFLKFECPYLRNFRLLNGNPLSSDCSGLLFTTYCNFWFT